VKRVGAIAGREFLATVATKGFVLGVLLTPVLVAILALLMPRLMSRQGASVVGEVAIADPTGRVAEPLRAYFLPESVEKRRADLMRQAIDQLPGAIGPMAARAPQGAMQAALGGVPDLTWTEVSTSNVDAEKAPLGVTGEGRRRLALVVIHPHALERGPGQSDFGTYDLYVRGNLDDRFENELHLGLRDAIVGGRVRAQNLDVVAIETLMRVTRPRSVTVARGEERETVRAFNMMLPAAFVMLLFMAVMLGGQSLLTTTVEEKGSRVVEVLLSAVSPMELMTGKILGQMAVSSVVLGVYVAMGLVLLFSFTLLGLLDLTLLLYLLIFFAITYLVVGALMAAVGAAVNDMGEAQSLMTPIMLLLVTPFVLWFPISRDPNSLFSTIISFVPPVNTFAMLLRLTSVAPPPAWQVWLTIGIGVLSVFAALWFAAKVFRVGLLMHGKPPNFATLVRWVRMA
jgi:ABC-2 type transport system permease protein